MRPEQAGLQIKIDIPFRPNWFVGLFSPLFGSKVETISFLK